MKTAYTAGSSGHYEFTTCLFGLCNAGFSFCHLVEQCLVDQQFVTLWLYLDDIFVFTLNIDVLLDHIELVFNRLKEFDLKINPKTTIFGTSVLFLGHVLSAWGISANPAK